MSRRHVSRVCAFLLSVTASPALVGGCSESAAPAKFPSARIEGSVTLDGKPIQDGTIQFVPDTKGSGGVTQATILQGRYVASKVALGKGTAFLFMKPPEPPENVTSAYMPPPMVTVPDRYKNGLPIDIKGDKTDEDFDLTSKK